jgi:hypothetical protein
MMLLVNILTVYGIANIITGSGLFSPIKNKATGRLNEFLNCMMCVGFQIGWVLGVFDGPFSWWNVILNGGFYSGTTWLLHTLVVYLGAGDYPVRILNVSRYEDTNEGSEFQ